jgi:hypothetical protein
MNAYDPQAYTILGVDSMQTAMAAPLHLAGIVSCDNFLS